MVGNKFAETVEHDAALAERGDGISLHKLRAELLSLQPGQVESLSEILYPNHLGSPLSQHSVISLDHKGNIEAITFEPALPDRMLGARPVEITLKGLDTTLEVSMEGQDESTHFVDLLSQFENSMHHRVHRITEEPDTPEGIVNALLKEQKRRGELLGDIVISSHGSSDGWVQMGKHHMYLNDREFLHQFGRLKGKISPSARIIFDGCKIASGKRAPEAIQALANETGNTVRAFEWTQSAWMINGYGPFLERAPKPPHQRLP